MKKVSSFIVILVVAIEVCPFSSAATPNKDEDNWISHVSRPVLRPLSLPDVLKLLLKIKTEMTGEKGRSSIGLIDTLDSRQVNAKESNGLAKKFQSNVLSSNLTRGNSRTPLSEILDALSIEHKQIFFKKLASHSFLKQLKEDCKSIISSSGDLWREEFNYINIESCPPLKDLLTKLLDHFERSNSKELLGMLLSQRHTTIKLLKYTESIDLIRNNNSGADAHQLEHLTDKSKLIRKSKRHRISKRSFDFSSLASLPGALRDFAYYVVGKIPSPASFFSQLPNFIKTFDLEEMLESTRTSAHLLIAYFQNDWNSLMPALYKFGSTKGSRRRLMVLGRCKQILLEQEFDRSNPESIEAMKANVTLHASKLKCFALGNQDPILRMLKIYDALIEARRRTMRKDDPLQQSKWRMESGYRIKTLN